MKEYILVIDEGTTGTRALIFDKAFNVVGYSYAEIDQQLTPPDRVEQDLDEIYEKSVKVCKEAMAVAGLTAKNIHCIGIANQRNTIGLWDRETGKPIRPAIVWKDTRAAALLEDMSNYKYMREAYKRHGRPYVASSATIMLRWLMNNEPATAEAIRSGKICYGTIDTWLVWKLTNGRSHVITLSNVSSLGAYDVFSETWCVNLFEKEGIPLSILPTPVPETGDFGQTSAFGAPIQITGVVGDQQASLFAQGCHRAGSVKCTNGTGTFLDINIGDKFSLPPEGLATMIAWSIGGRRTFLLEGMLPVTGSVMKWLAEEAALVSSPDAACEVAMSVPDSGGVYFVVNLAGAYVPHYDPYARGAIFGISHATTKAHLVRATIEGIAFGVADIMDAVEKGCDITINDMKIDGGASKNDLLAQSFSDFIRCDVYRSKDSGEATAVGAAQIAAIGAGMISPEDVQTVIKYDRLFRPERDAAVCAEMLGYYRNASAISSGWLKDKKEV